MDHLSDKIIIMMRKIKIWKLQNHIDLIVESLEQIKKVSGLFDAKDVEKINQYILLKLDYAIKLLSDLLQIINYVIIIIKKNKCDEIIIMQIDKLRKIIFNIFWELLKFHQILQSSINKL